ncbi:MAG: hypothetical protein MZV64_67360 [Ignavibacteriales bacterium]|nr:hypothetical protein [Ignavibacteriales bacterium]
MQNLLQLLVYQLMNFRKQFYYLIENDLLYQFIKDGKFAIASSESNLAHRMQEENGKNDDDDE